MNLGIDASWAVNERAGVGRYSKELLHGITEILRNKDQLALFATYLTHVKEKDQRLESLMRRDQSRTGSPHVVATHVWLPGGLKESLFRQTWVDPLLLFFNASLDIYHAHTVQAFPLYPYHHHAIKRVLTLHDLSYIHYPKHLGEVAKQLTWQTRQAVALADAIICDSQATMHDAVTLVSAPRDKCRVIHLAQQSVFNQPPSKTAISTVRRKYQLPNEFLLFVGTIEPRKNIARLIEAYELLPREIKKRYPLLLVGGLGWQYDDVELALAGAHCQLSNSSTQPIRYLGYLSDAELVVLYRLAKLFIYPSLLEGFGIPPLEAMSQGAPVVTSRVSSLPEVVDTAALTIDPESVPAIHRAIKRLINDDSLCRKLSHQGRRRAKHFSWRKTATATYQVYQELMSETSAS